MRLVLKHDGVETDISHVVIWFSIWVVISDCIHYMRVTTMNTDIWDMYQILYCLGCHWGTKLLGWDPPPLLFCLQQTFLSTYIEFNCDRIHKTDKTDNNSVHPIQLKRDAACLPHICVQGRVSIYDCFKVQFDGLGKNPQIYTTWIDKSPYRVHVL